MTTQKGQVVILIILALGIISFSIGLSLIKTGFRELVMGRSEVLSAKAFYVANSGIEEAFYQIGQNPSYGVLAPVSFDLVVGTGKAHVSVYGTEGEKTIESVGTDGRYVRKLKVGAKDTSLGPGFEHAIHAGQGGFELRNNTLIKGKNGTRANIYSNGSIKGAKSNCGNNSASKIDGSVWAVDKIGKLEENDSGVCITQDAHAGLLDYCYIQGSANSPLPPSANCPYDGQWIGSSPPDPLPLPEMGISILKNYLTAGGKIFSGDCILDGSGGPLDCSGGTGIIGEMIITGNLRKPSNVDFKVSGPIWIKGNVIFDSLGSVGLTPDITEVSQMVVVDGTIFSDSNVTFSSSGRAFLFLISTFAPEISEICDNPAITVSSNTNSVLFYATEGCVMVNSNATFHGAILGEKIRIESNSMVEYDPDLQLAIFGLSKTSSWQAISFEEE